MSTPQIFLGNISDLSELEGDDNEILFVAPSEEDRNVSDSYFRGLNGKQLYEALYERLEEALVLGCTETDTILDEIKSRLERFDVLDSAERMRQAKERYDIARNTAISTGR